MRLKELISRVHEGLHRGVNKSGSCRTTACGKGPSGGWFKMTLIDPKEPLTSSHRWHESRRRRGRGGEGKREISLYVSECEVVGQLLFINIEHALNEEAALKKRWSLLIRRWSWTAT